MYWGAAHSPHSVDISLLRIGLHVTPKKLRETLQVEIDAVDLDAYDAVVLAYGLCGKATAGLRAGKIRWSCRGRMIASRFFWGDGRGMPGNLTPVRELIGTCRILSSGEMATI